MSKDRLTAKTIENLKAKDRAFSMSDGGGLSIEVTADGKKRWRFRYQLNGKASEISLGAYPDVPLRGFEHKELGIWIKGARDLRDECRILVAAGKNPAAARRASKVVPEEDNEGPNTFQSVALEWHGKNASKWTPGHGKTNLRRLEANIFPFLGKVGVDKITTQMLVKALEAVEERGAIETAHRTLSICRMVFDYAVRIGLTERNPASSLRGALRPVNATHHPAITDPDEVGGLLRAIDTYKGGVIVRHALQLAPLVFVRPGELRQAEWSEIDFDKAIWSIPAGKMKMREPHLVPLSRQSLAILRGIQSFTGESKFVFPSPAHFTRPLSNNGVLAALRSMGYDRDTMSGHGFRAMARTIMDEVLGFPAEHIEQQLAHAVRDPLGRAYNRTKHLPQRQEMMQKWADYLDVLKLGVVAA